MTQSIADSLSQIGDLALDAAKPLLIVDADEVLFLFLQGLERFIARRGLYLDLKSFALTGNIKQREDDTPLSGFEVKALLADFFVTETEHLDPAPGAAHALRHLSQHAQIVILSNVPPAQRHARIAGLKRCDMAYPVIANEGAKGPAIAVLAQRVNAPVVFVDDLPPNLQSAADNAPQTIRVHMVADPRLRLLIPKAPAAHARHDDWPEAVPFIQNALHSGPVAFK
jgi:hypothetical protein